MKYLIRFLISFFLFAAAINSTQAAAIFQITTGNTSITLPPGGTTTITYTVKNMSGTTIPNMSYVPPALTTLNPSTSCGATLANNVSCTVVLSLTAPLQSGQLTLGPLGVCGFNGNICSVANADNRVHLRAGVGLAIAAGQYQSTTLLFPLLAQSLDEGFTWTYPESIITQLPSDFSEGLFGTSSCNGGLLCMAAGAYTDNLAVQKPWIAITTNGGSSWSYAIPLPTDFVEDGVFQGISCSGNLCVGGGSYSNGSVRKPLLAVSSNSGSVWTFITTLPSDFGGPGTFFSTTSSGSLCIAGGAYDSSTPPNVQKPMLAVSNNGGVTWNYITTLPADYNGHGIIHGTSCSGNLCIAGGAYVNNALKEKPLLGVSVNSGVTWIYIATLPTDFNNLGEILGTSCSGKLCAVGGDYLGSLGTQPLLAVSNNSGVTWNYITTLPADYAGIATFHSTSCSGTLCVAGGQYRASGMTPVFKPMLAVSNSSGVVWHYITTLPTDFGSNGIIFNVSCNRNFCVAGGRYTTNDTVPIVKPLLAVSTDAGMTWSYVATLPTDYVDDGFFGAVSSGNVSRPKPK